MLAATLQGKVAFGYTEEWIEHGFMLNPFKLPLEAGVFMPHSAVFGWLHGTFADSLPDAWGQLLLARMLRKHETDAADLSPLDRLAYVGDTGLGALTYKPHISMDRPIPPNDYDEIATL